MASPIDYGAFERGQECNYWELNRALQREVERRCAPDDQFRERLADFGETMGHTIAPKADVVADNPPKLRPYDSHGERINEVQYHPAHHEMERIIYERGLVADLFEAPSGRDEPLSAVEHQALMHLMGYASNYGISCPLPMTIGAAFVLEEFDDGSLDAFYEALTSRTYEDLATGAMFLTEKQGGSDIGSNQVRADPTDQEGLYTLHGEKWFCSNPDAGAALVLARRPEAPDGIEGLSLFCLSTVDADPATIHFRRLKDKLGTRSVPTAEIVFEGTEAHLVGEPEEGFRYMSTMLNRIRSFMGGVGGRPLLEAKIHAANRETWGTRLDDHPLMRQDLVEMTVTYEAGLVMAFETAALYDRVEDGDDAAEGVLRMLIPVGKFRGTRKSIEAATMAMEIRGGDGYVEEQVHPRLVRNAHVSTIWEGASNIVALDTLRAMTTDGAHRALLTELGERLAAIEHPRLDGLVTNVGDELDALGEAFAAIEEENREAAELAAKRLAGFAYDVTAAVLLLERAAWRLETARDARETLVAEWFVRTRLGEPERRRIADPDRLPTEAFDAIVRYARVEPDAQTVIPRGQ